ncbi:unnamed protein product [Rhizoctonia solani]|uniref:Transmembrane protein n=2 Tax=Rhizoctonia solani TaxID=456999 RepID=A0A8H3C4K9_9AGAM|nr:putative transmembrane protein [Rhizoctonia solani 123E]CAE6474847.1 unnamed protein product [Rhizoctonia solani]
MSGLSSKRDSTGSAHAGAFEQDSGRATRARTRLIVEGLSNLAIIATFYAGILSQFISMTNENKDGPLAIATNACFFGGLMFSVFTAVLATLSARWFSILREDDADYLSSRWLSQDSKHEDPALLRKYLNYQIGSMEKIQARAAPVNQSTESSPFSPVHFDATCILELLKQERGKDLEMARTKDEAPLPEEDMKSTLRERFLSVVLLSPLIACLPSFALFATGILLLVWDKQPRAVAIFTSVTVLICIIPLCGFFVNHRHKYVIRHIYLGRPSY